MGVLRIVVVYQVLCVFQDEISLLCLLSRNIRNSAEGLDDRVRNDILKESFAFLD